ncbi:hypothetical protein PG995_013607 [Apiospora arundinis]
MYVTLPAVMNMMLMTTLSSKILCPFLFVIARLGGPSQRSKMLVTNAYCSGLWEEEEEVFEK